MLPYPVGQEIKEISGDFMCLAPQPPSLQTQMYLQRFEINFVAPG